MKTHVIPANTQQLHLKSYFGETVPRAVSRARTDLGPDALIIDIREAPAYAKQYGNYEVVCSLSDWSAPLPESNLPVHTVNHAPLLAATTVKQEAAADLH